MHSIVNTLLMAVLLIGTVLLQIFLSKRESKWPGLVLPIISFIFAVLQPLLMVLPPEGVAGGFVLDTIIVFLLAIIPTIILLAIYFGCRERIKRKKALEKMNIQDLE